MRKTAAALILGIALMSNAFAQQSKDTGASVAFTSNDPVIKKALALVNDGKFSEAQAILASDDGHSDANVARAREEMLDVIGRLRREYSLDEAGLLEKIKKQVSDATAADLKKWRDAGEVQYRVIDGKVMYFRREPSNIFRFSADAKSRMKKSSGGEAQPGWRLTDHLKEVVSQAESTGKTDVCPLTHRVEYSISVPTSSLTGKTGSLARIWLPFPQEYRQQKDVKLISETLNGEKYEPQIAPNASPQRTAYFEQKITDASKPIEAKIVFEYTSFAYYLQLDDARVRPLPADFDRTYLSVRPPHIAFTPQIKDLVAKIVDGESNPLARVRKIYHWIDANVRYHAEEEYCVIPSFATACLSRHKGDCGIQSTLFITMCRAAGVPARWQSGWETKPVGWTMHDWAEIYIAPWGWVPCDMSYGVQKSEDPKIADFYIGHQDSHRMIVNLDYGRELIPPKNSLRSEPADFQRGEVEIDGKNLYFDEWDYDIKIWIDGKQI